MTYWTYVSLSIFSIGLLMLFIVDRIVQTVWRVVTAKNGTHKMVDGIRGIK